MFLGIFIGNGAPTIYQICLEIRHIVQPLNRGTGRMTDMRCPHLSINEKERICQRMVEEGMDGKISDFDFQHYCNGNPINCYYFRSSNNHKKERPDKETATQNGQIFTTA